MRPSEYILVVFIVLLLSVGSNCILGAITLIINHSKGYNSGFQWGFFFGVIGIVVVACRPYEIHYACKTLASSMGVVPPQKSIAAPAPSQPPRQIRCPSCGALSPVNSTFCTKCGKNLKEQ